ncbi:hypothetical protein HT745_16675 [Pseudosulfitobacter pseudonitzschiae]|uniref:hypothetical protein n=1 Tax=Pseudosulfitobacter pseudonitzschiae TaxID=1402135 RepID=UPI001582D5EC|nr:hypothetical protein [Pseudosulfitobacter pseudonitzschiae]QKS10008.1 hypothetical protein HT745_16675 [Pseudosulfitobacter pseudonitzschiae]
MRFFTNHVSVAKGILLLAFAAVAPFVDLNNPITHWAWVLFVLLSVGIFSLEVLDFKQKKIPPEDNVRMYLLDFDGWKRSGDVDYYVADPRFTIRELQDSTSLDFQQEWTRGEIGSHYDHGNAAFYLGVYFGDTLLRKIHVVLFDGGKKIVVAPAWESIGNGRIYYYVADSIEYAYQRFLCRERGVDFSKSISGPGRSDSFDIPVFRDASELKKYLSQYGGEPVNSTSDRDEQNRLFSENLEKFRCFKEGWIV